MPNSSKAILNNDCKIVVFIRFRIYVNKRELLFGCDDSDNPDNRIQEGIEISGILAKTVENGTEIKYPTEITPFLTLRCE